MTRAAFDADVLVHAAIDGHPHGSRVLRLLEDPELERVGSVLLLPEILAKPMREGTDETGLLLAILGRLVLHPFETSVALMAVDLAARYRLRAADACHLATGVAAGADLFVTNNRKDFGTSITEIDIVYPDALPD